MKTILPVWIAIVMAVSLLLGFSPLKEKIEGAWRRPAGSSGEQVVLTLTDSYLMQTTYSPTAFVGSRGGPYELSGAKLRLTVEFDTQDSSRVGQVEEYSLNLSNQQLALTGLAGRLAFERIENTNHERSLAGLWRITGREGDNGQLTTMQRGPRKTIKLLTGTRFQWAAINPQTRQFFGTGGGTYTLRDGKYTETIDFFSRDNARVGRSLTFDCEVKQNQWFHRGKNSTGGRLAEVWSRE